MARSSRTRRLKAKAKKNAKHATVVNTSVPPKKPFSIKNIDLNDTDTRYIIGFAALSVVITAGYWSIGGRNILVFPAIFCIAVGARKHWKGPLTRFAEDGK